MVDWVSFSIAITSLVVSLAISIVSLIISWKGLQLGFGAFLSVEEIEGETIIKNLGEALAHNLNVSFIDRNGNSFVKLTPIPFISKNDEYKFTLEKGIFSWKFINDLKNDVETKNKKYPKLTDIRLLKITYTDIHGKTKYVYFSSLEVGKIMPRFYTIISKTRYKIEKQKLRVSKSKETEEVEGTITNDDNSGAGEK